MSKPLRIGLEMQGGTNWMGGAEYIKNIILALASLPDDVRSTFEICLICDKTIDPNILSQIRPHLTDIFWVESSTLLRKIDRIFRRDIFNEYHLNISRLLKKNSKYNLDFVYPYFTTKPTDIRPSSAAWIPDFQHKYLPSFFSLRHIQIRDREFNNIALYAQTIILSSESARINFREYFPDREHKVKILSFTTIPSPTWYELEPIEVIERYKLPDKFFIVSNQFWRHKNHLTIFNALKLLNDRGIYPTVVCTGNLSDDRHKEYAGEIIKKIEELGIGKQVHLLGVIPKADQIQLLRASIAAIQPSLFEGWSTIVEESRCLGKKIILSDIPVHLEQNPPEAIFFKKDSPEELSKVLASYWNKIEFGLDLDREYIARQTNSDRVQTFAHNFLDIIKDTMIDA